MSGEPIESLGRLKAGVDCDYSLTRARKKRLVKLYEAKLEDNRPTVKFVEPPRPSKRVKKHLDPNDIFTLAW